MSPNDIIKLKPTNDGWTEIIHHVDAHNEYLRNKCPRAKFRVSVPIADEHGYIKGQFWELMQYFDWSKGAGCDIHFHDMQITRIDDVMVEAAAEAYWNAIPCHVPWSQYDNAEGKKKTRECMREALVAAFGVR